MNLDLSVLSQEHQALFSTLYANALHAGNENSNSTSGQDTGGESNSGGNQQLVNDDPIPQIETGIESKTQ